METIDIKQIREGLKLTQEQFAKRLGVATKTISNWENGSIIPQSKYDAIKALIAQSQQEGFSFFEAVKSPGAGTGNDVGISVSSLNRIMDEMKSQREDFMAQLERKDKQIEELIKIIAK